MATTTTNYGFDIPQSTDLVKDGATAIATLGQDIDTAMNTALGTKKAGMVLLNTTSFSGVSAQNFSNVFDSSKYDAYKVSFSTFGSSGGAVTSFRFRENVTDKATNYYGAGWYTTVGSGSGVNYPENNSAQIRLVANNTSALNGNFCEFDIRVINGGTTGYIVGFAYDPWNDLSNSFGYRNNSMTAATGFSIYASTGTLTGKLNLYGYNL